MFFGKLEKGCHVWSDVPWGMIRSRAYALIGDGKLRRNYPDELQSNDARIRGYLNEWRDLRICFDNDTHAAAAKNSRG
jgi:hypothetical protein